MIRRPVRRRALAAALLASAAAALAPPPVALAQPATPAEEIVPPGIEEEVPAGPAYGDAGDAAFIGTLGFLGGVGPDYPGSDDYEFVPAPYLRLEYRDLLFLHGRRAGANLLRLGSRRDGLGLRAGPVVRLDQGRDDENAAVDDLDDVDPGAEAGAFVELAYLFAALKLEARQEVAGGHGGLVVEVDADTSLPLTPRLRVDLGVGAAWADDDYMDAYFAVDPEEGPLAGFRPFDPDPGIKSVSAQLGASYFLTDHWLLRLQTAYGRLLGDAADSPIVADTGSANQFYAGLGAAYRFAF